MRSLVILAAAASVALAACSGGASPSASPVPSPSTPGSSPDVATYWLRLTTWQAIPPVNQFAGQPVLVITGDGIAVMPGPMMEIYPGPLVPPLVGRQVSDAGRAAIMQTASDLGLLGGKTDFMPQNPLMGGVTGRIELTLDGQRVTLTGDPAALMECPSPETSGATGCQPPPGTPQAFAQLWSQLTGLPSWLGQELGPEAAYVPAAYSILVGAPPEPDAELPQAPADWPLDQPLATFGGPVANGTARCGTLTGADADTVRPALAAANTLTPWVDSPESSAAFGLTVRPLTPGEDACAEVFGGG